MASLYIRVEVWTCTYAKRKGSNNGGPAPLMRLLSCEHSANVRGVSSSKVIDWSLRRSKVYMCLQAGSKE